MKIFRYISITAIILIVIFVNLNEDTPIWDLVYNMQFYLIVSVFLYFGFKLCKDLLTHSTLFTVGIYYLFELIVDIIHILNTDLYTKIYSTRNVNYIVTIGFMLALITVPIINRLKKKKDV